MSTLIFLCPMLSGCGVPTSANTFPGSASTNGPAFRPQTGQPFAYVAQTCASASSCSSPTGLVQIIGGATITNGIEDPQTLALDHSGNLYVGNSTASNAGDVSVYAPEGTTPQRTLSGVVGVPKGLVANDAGRLWVIAQYKAGCCNFEGTGAIFAPGATGPKRRLRGLSGFAHAPVLDKYGNLYVANFDVFPGWVSVYPHGRHVPSHVIQNGIGLPIGMAIAPNQDLVVINGLFNHTSDVTVYPHGQSTPSLTITAGVHFPTSVAIDADGNIYVGNSGNKKGRGGITVYRQGQKTILRSMHSGVAFPAALGIDSSGRLYVANVPDKGANTIAVFAPGGSTPVDTYTLTEQFSSLAVPR